MNFKETYEKNRVALNGYKWRRHGAFPDWEQLSVKAEKAEENEFFYRMGEYVSKPIKIERSIVNTKPFFRDLSKPLLLKNEFNTYNIEYVVDNVRQSEYYGGDNHVYLYYDDMKDFALLLQVVDITPLLKENKIVFLFGKEDLALNYPLDFKGIYGIDYDNEPPKPIRVEEIKRIFLTWSINPASRVRSFFYPLLDGLPNTIYFSIQMPFDQFVAIYRCFLQGKTVLQFAECFFTEFLDIPDWGGKWKDAIRSLFASEKISNIEEALDKKFWRTILSLFPLDYVPNEIEWLKAFALAKAADFGQNANARIAPAIAMFFNNTTRQVSMIENNLLPVLRKFKYIRIISIIRRLTINAGSHVDDHSLNKWNLVSAVTWFIERRRPNKKNNQYFDDFYISENDEFLPFRKVMRFEDLKLEPIASIEALCDFFDIPMDEVLSKSFLEKEHSYKNPNSGKVSKGFSTTAVFDLHEMRFSPYDYYRMEVVMGKAYENYGYKPIYYTDGKNIAMMKY